MKFKEHISEGLGRGREDDEYHTPDPKTRTHKVAVHVSKDGVEKHSRTVTFTNSTKTSAEAHAAAREHLKKQGYKIHEGVKETPTGRVHTKDDYEGYPSTFKDKEETKLKSSVDRHRMNKAIPSNDKLKEESELDEATPYYNKPSFLKNMGRIAKQERLAREKKEKEAAEKKEVKEDVATSEYKIKKTVGQDGKTHTRKVRPHVVRFQNSKSDGEPAQNTNRDDKEDMKKESIEMVSFSQFQQEGVMDTLKKVGKKVLDTVGHGDDEAMKKDLQKKMGVPQTGKPSMAKQNEELKGGQKELDKNKNGKLDADDFKKLRKEEFELQEESIVEERINHREFASDGHMHPSMANHPAYKAGGGHVDFYASKTGDKVEGKVVKNDGKQVHIKDTKGTTHKFKVSNTAPHQMKEETELDESIDFKNAPMGDVVKDFQKSDAPQFAGKSDKKRQQMAVAAKLSAERGGKKMSFKEMMEIYSAPAIVEGSEDEKENEVAEANAFDWKSGGHKETGKFDKKTTATGTQYTRKYDAKTGETKSDDDKPAEKRGRGRPAGSKTGAAQKGSEKKSDYRGIDRTTYAIHLPK